MDDRATVVGLLAAALIGASILADRWGGIHDRVLPPRSERPARALSFGSIAENYERYRMGYPDELVAAVLHYAGRPVRRALEVGAGTGKATRLIAGHGIDVTALEPDADMAQVLRRTTRGLPVRVEIMPFEPYRAGQPFELLYAAEAWHWTDPAHRWAGAARLLEPRGVLALFGRRQQLVDPAYAAAVEVIERRVFPDFDEPAGTPWSSADIGNAEGLTDVVEATLPSVSRFTAERFVAREGTSSAYLVLGAPERDRALREIRAVLPDEVDVDTTVRLTLARRN
jgi:SAM-dependent methyltransferase